MRRWRAGRRRPSQRKARRGASPTDGAFGPLYDREGAEPAPRAGAGATIRVRLGGKHDRLHGDPLDLEVYVKSLADGQFRLSTPMGRGYPMGLGRTARLIRGGMDIIVASKRPQG